MIITKVQENLARKALLQPNTQFDDLYNLIRQREVLETVLSAVLQNDGARTGGIDGITKYDINHEQVTRELENELWDGSYTPQPVKRVYIPKANGKMRPLGIPTIRDRVVQEALRLVLEPILESHFLDCSTGFRPSRRTMDALHLTTYFGSNRTKMWWVVEGDIKGCFDNIPHKKLIGVLKQYVRDKKLVELIRKFLRAGIFEKGKISTPNKGVPQGGIVSPLLTNMYLHELDKYWWNTYGSLNRKEKEKRRSKELGNVQFIRYADDFIILTNGRKKRAYELKDEFTDVLNGLGLELSQEKTLVTHMNDGFDFLGFNVKRVFSQQSNKHIILVTPSQRNIDKFKERIREMTETASVNDNPYNKIRAINHVVNGWGNYYRHVNSSKTFAKLTTYTHMRMYHWLKRKHANMSSKVSVKGFVIKTYLRRKMTIYGRKSVTTFGVIGAILKPMNAIKLRRYRIKRPKSGNVYLENDNMVTGFKETIPIADTYWRGNTSQNAYAIPRAEKMRLVGYKCERCNSTDKLDAHHIKPQRKGGKHNIGNLEILCRSCHIAIHSGKKSTITP